MFEIFADQTVPVLLGVSESIRGYCLTIGICGFIGGVFLFLNHRRHFDEVVNSDASERVVKFELRKFRRRSIVSAMITSVGCIMSSLFWVSDERVFCVFILMTLGLLAAILGVAIIDMFSVGLQQIATPDQKAEKAMVDEYLRQREKLAQRDEE